MQRAAYKAALLLSFDQSSQQTYLEEQPPCNEAETGDNTCVQENHYKVAHYVTSRQPCDTKCRKCPERLNHIGPLVTPSDSHCSTTVFDTHLSSGRHYDRSLNSPLAAA